MQSQNKHKYTSVPTYEDDEGSKNQSSLLQTKLVAQDASLDLLSESVERLGNMSLTISKEIKNQNKNLNHLDSEIEAASEKASFVVKKTLELVKKSGGPKSFLLILILILILISLGLLVIYT